MALIQNGIPALYSCDTKQSASINKMITITPVPRIGLNELVKLPFVHETLFEWIWIRYYISKTNRH